MTPHALVRFGRRVSCSCAAAGPIKATYTLCLALVVPVRGSPVDALGHGEPLVRKGVARMAAPAALVRRAYDVRFPSVWLALAVTREVVAD